jgi:hypothetical protein
MSAPGHPCRRRALLVAAFPVGGAMADALMTMPSDDRRMLADIVSELGLMQPAVRQLTQRICSNADAALLIGASREGTGRLRAIIGQAPGTAKASLPSLVEDDFASGRTVHVHGVSFSYTELALLLAVGGMTPRSMAA